MYLLDSNTLYWWVTDAEKIPSNVRQLLQDSDHAVFYSVITPWELSIKNAKGKLPLPRQFFEKIPELGFDCLPVEEKHVQALRALPKLHGDPFDRMLVAQAKREKLTLITADKHLAKYPIKTLIVGA